MGEVSPGNRLNELSAQEWLRFTKTWFIHNPAKRKKNELLHPAKYPEGMVEEFVRFFTKKGDVVFDPFLGTGSTLLACYLNDRNGVGIELQRKYAAVARERLQQMEQQLKLAADSGKGAKLTAKQVVIEGDAAQLTTIWQNYTLPAIDFVITSPPYGPMLNKKGLISKNREEQGLDIAYSADKNDLGNANSYEEFLTRLVEIFVNIKKKLKPGGHVVVILQNYMHKGEYITLAWDFARCMKEHFQLRGERIWLQDNKTLYPYGYKYSYVPNVHHHYCLIFKKVD